MRRDIRAFSVGLGVFVALEVVFLGLATQLTDVPPLVGWIVPALWYAAPLISGFVYGCIATKPSSTTVLLQGVASSICVGSLNLAADGLGVPVDLGGVQSLGWVVGLSMIVILPLVVLGCGAGAALRTVMGGRRGCARKRMDGGVVDHDAA